MWPVARFPLLVDGAAPQRRLLDNAPVAVIEFVERDESAKGVNSGPKIERHAYDE